MSWLAVALGLSGVWKWFRWKINANCSCEGAAPLWFRSDSRSYSFRNASELHMCFEVNMKWHSQPIFFRIVPYVQIKWVVRYRMRFNLSVENEQHTKTDQDLNVCSIPLKKRSMHQILRRRSSSESSLFQSLFSTVLCYNCCNLS